MISALVLSPSLSSGKPQARANEAVARSLGALVRAAVEGILRDVAIAGVAEDGLAALADHAGCAIIETNSARDALAQAVVRMRGDIAFVLEGGFAPPGGFAQEASDLLMNPALFQGALLRLTPDSLFTRFAPGLARPVGALAPRDALKAAAPRDLPDLIGRLKIRTSFQARAQRVV
jgi:hypothetical protein